MEIKKLLVISDTHGRLSALKAVLNWAKNRTPPNDGICGAVFLGDGISDLNLAANATGFFSEWKLVNGNNDYGHSMPESAVYDFAGRRILLTHGHRHSLYGEYHVLVNSAKATEASIVLFGHTHVPCNKEINGITLINPGSVGNPRSRIGATFAVISFIPSGSLKVDFFGIGAQYEIKGVKI